MRSEQVFSVSGTYGNRFEICRVASRTARLLHQPSTAFCNAISRAFEQMAVPASSQLAASPAVTDVSKD